LGAAVLYYQFKSIGLDMPLWSAIFHSVSAFCTAGFSLFSDSFSGSEFPVSIKWTISVLSILGSIGFIVFVDIQHYLLGKRRVTLTTKIILVATLLLCVIGSSLIWLVEIFQTENPISFFDSFFQLMSAHTTVGFNSVDINQLSYASLFFMIIVMMVGSCPSGTGGGIKITSITAMYATVKTVFRSRKHVTFLGKEIPSSNIYLALTTVSTYLVFLFVCTLLLLLIEKDNFDFLYLLFEAASALSTVGLSTGISDELCVASKLVICFLMFIGRIGVISLGYALIKKAPIIRYTPSVEDIAV
jgi:trk system potassium uptake protein TrkH